MKLPIDIDALLRGETVEWERLEFLPATQIDVVWFRRGPGGDTFTEKIFSGPLHMMVRDALEYIERLCLDETVIKHSDRAEATRVSNFPSDAVEEAVVNAFPGGELMIAESDSGTARPPSSPPSTPQEHAVRVNCGIRDNCRASRNLHTYS